jgi:hypothetical protein
MRPKEIFKLCDHKVNLKYQSYKTIENNILKGNLKVI